MLLLALANGGYVVATYVTTTVTARVLDPSGFATFGVIMAWVSVLTALLVKGLATSIAREMAAGDVDEATAWRAGRSLGIRVSVGLAVVGVAVSPLVGRWLGSDDLVQQLAIAAVGAVTFGVNAILLAWPTGRREYGWQAFAQVGYGIARIVLVAGGAWVAGVDGAVVGYVLAPLAAAAPLVRRWPRAGADIAPVRARMRRLFPPVAATSVAVTAFFVVDVFAMSSVLGGDAPAVGVYVAYGAIAHVPFFLLQAASVAMVPAIAAAAARQSAIRRTLTDTVVLLAGPTALLVTAGDAAARVVFGTAYDTSGLVVAPLALATAAVTLIAGFVGVDVALARLRSTLLIAAGGVAGVFIGARGAADAASATATDVAWVVAAASIACAVALAVSVRVRHGALFEWTRTALGCAVATLVCLPPLAAADDALRLGAAIGCSLIWLAIVLRAGLIDLRRSTPAPIELEPAL